MLTVAKGHESNFKPPFVEKDMSDLRKWHELEAPSAVNVGTPLSLDGENNGKS